MTSPSRIRATPTDDRGDRGPTRSTPTTVETELADGQLAYDCAAWAGESRGLLTSLLTTAGIAHAWQGTMLTVREEDEEAVDELIDDVLARRTTGAGPVRAEAGLRGGRSGRSRCRPSWPTR